MICLQCGQAAIHTEDYDGIPIGTCDQGHRTGKELRESIVKPEGLEFVLASWEEAERRAIELLKKAS